MHRPQYFPWPLLSVNWQEWWLWLATNFLAWRHFEVTKFLDLGYVHVHAVHILMQNTLLWLLCSRCLNLCQSVICVLGGIPTSFFPCPGLSWHQYLYCNAWHNNDCCPAGVGPLSLYHQLSFLDIMAPTITKRFVLKGDPKVHISCTIRRHKKN